MEGGGQRAEGERERGGDEGGGKGRQKHHCEGRCMPYSHELIEKGRGTGGGGGMGGVGPGGGERL